MRTYERKTVKLGRAGGSRTVVLPKSWLRDLGMEDSVDLVRTEDGILIEAPHREPRSIEDEPEFALFLEFLAKSALAHPEELVNAVDRLAGNEDLLEGVECEE
jgi:hypothetical protein